MNLRPRQQDVRVFHYQTEESPKGAASCSDRQQGNVSLPTFCSFGKAGTTVTSTVSMANRARKSIGRDVLQVASPPISMVNHVANILDDESQERSHTEFDTEFDDLVHDPDGFQQQPDKAASGSSFVPANECMGEMTCCNGGVHFNLIPDSQLEGRLQSEDDFVDPDVAIRTAEGLANITPQSTPGWNWTRIRSSNICGPCGIRSTRRRPPSWTLVEMETLQTHLREKHAAGTDGKVVRMAGEVSWPPSLNSLDALKRPFNFKEIMVTLTGTDHITGDTVYSHTKYAPADMALDGDSPTFFKKILMDPWVSTWDSSMSNWNRLAAGESSELDGGNPDNRVHASPGWMRVTMVI
jgi:hypothetical protein